MWVEIKNVFSLNVSLYVSVDNHCMLVDWSNYFIFVCVCFISYPSASFSQNKGNISTEPVSGDK